MCIRDSIGTVIAGFSEEIMFRGMLLNTLKGKIPLISAMIISSLGFSVMHITTIFAGKTLIQALVNVIDVYKRQQLMQETL